MGRTSLVDSDIVGSNVQIERDLAEARAGFPSRGGGERAVAARAALAKLLWGASGLRRVPPAAALDRALTALPRGELWWMTDLTPLGPIYLTDSQKDNHSPALLDRVDDATNQIINVQLERARDVVTSQQNSIARLVDSLLEQDTLDAEEIQRCFENPVAAQPA